MKRWVFYTCLIVTSIAASVTVHAAVKACNAARVSAGDCTNASTQTIVLYALPTADLLELADEIAETYGYPTITCSSADIAASPPRCSAGQLGQAVTTPETKTAFANRLLGEELRRRIERRRKRLAALAAEAGATTPQPIE